MKEKIIFTDRYGGNYPDPKTICDGDCEGMGFYPEPTSTNKDGTINLDTKWSFIKCKECNGTGKKLTSKEID